MWAHPRSRGENGFYEPLFITNSGSSPLARGKQQPWREGRRCFRLIPARAGKTVERRAGSWRAHPRSRGENISDRRGEHSRPGSSPLARGKLEGRLAALSGQRLIPARAGKTLAIGTKTPTHPAHPRSRGENNLSEDDSSFWRGSSPLARGKPPALRPSPAQDGLIPARAGKTIRPQTSSPKAAAHPRSRGENRSARDTGGSSQGSSPLARGKLLACAAGVLWRRLIPARAGKTIPPALSRR